ncbi:TPA: hypothetical protein ACGO8N_000887 [Streptococcus suis]
MLELKNISKQYRTGDEVQTTLDQVSLTFSYLKMKLPAEEISSLIGYSEVNAFSRAFKNWTGMTVTDYKKQQGL